MKNDSAQTHKRVLIKIGGNALTDHVTKDNIVNQICEVIGSGIEVVLVHGGGIEIEDTLKKAGITTEFVGGHRKTDAISIPYVEMALSSRVNKELVSLFNRKNIKTVGISGKDGITATARKRYHIVETNGQAENMDIGFVGDVEKMDPTLVDVLLQNGYLPVVSPVSFGVDGETYNINADMFAGHLAGALQVDKFVAMTNIDGLLQDINDPESIIHNLTVQSSKDLYGSVIQGGMIPKIDACLQALELGVPSSHIINGTDKENLLRILRTNDTIGTEITIDPQR